MRDRGGICTAVGYAIAGGLLLAWASAGLVRAQDPSQAQPGNPSQPATAPSPANAAEDQAPSAAERRFIDSLRNRAAHSLSPEERTKAAEIAQGKPSMDISINFEESETIGANARIGLRELGRALSRDELKGTIFLINGYSDGEGSAERNQDLSERRAEAVKRFLVDEFKVPADSLVAIGYGKSKLNNEAGPYARVQVVNTSVPATAK